MARRLNWKVLTLTLATSAGCSQIIGLSDYDIDPGLDAAGGEAGEGGSNSGGGTKPKPDAGEANAGEGMVGPAGAGGMGAAGEAGMPGAAGAGGAPLGQLIECEDAECCTMEGGTAVGVEMLMDGGFELGSPAEGNSPWEESSDAGIDIITNDLTLNWTPHTGEYYAYLAGVVSESAAIFSENFTVPADAGWMEVSGYRWFQIDSEEDTNEDFSAVALYNLMASDNIEELPLFWGAPDLSDLGFGDVTRWTKFTASFSAVPHRKHTRYLTIAASTDDFTTTSRQASSYLYDDVSLKVFRCYAQ
jgi:hypothetical protein